MYYYANLDPLNGHSTVEETFISLINHTGDITSFMAHLFIGMGDAVQ